MSPNDPYLIWRVKSFYIQTEERGRTVDLHQSIDIKYFKGKKKQLLAQRFVQVSSWRWNFKAEAQIPNEGAGLLRNVSSLSLGQTTHK